MRLSSLSIRRFRSYSARLSTALRQPLLSRPFARGRMAGERTLDGGDLGIDIDVRLRRHLQRPILVDVAAGMAALPGRNDTVALVQPPPYRRPAKDNHEIGRGAGRERGGTNG